MSRLVKDRLEEAIEEVRAVLLAVDRATDVYVLAPRRCGLEKLAEDMARDAPQHRIVLRYYKGYPEEAAYKTNHHTGAATFHFQTPVASDSMVLEHGDVLQDFPFDHDQRRYTVIIKKNRKKQALQ